MLMQPLLEVEWVVLKYYVVDAFADGVFQGNPAGICILPEMPEDELMQKIAAENNLSETAFVVQKYADEFDLRWFTPKMEIDLCGYATLASGFIVSEFVNKSIDTMRFHTLSGVLVVTKKDDLFEMDFPARKTKRTTITIKMQEAIGEKIAEAYCSNNSRDLLIILENEKKIQELKPDFNLLKTLANHLVVISSKGTQTDFVSRVFAPNMGINEDPVTGSTHTTLIPFWSERLNKKIMIAKQLSKRGGTLYCEDCGERVKISGKAVLYLTGEIKI